jgi:hypothetical protein
LKPAVLQRDAVHHRAQGQVGDLAVAAQFQVLFEQRALPGRGADLQRE